MSTPGFRTNFLEPNKVRNLISHNGTPLFVYSRSRLTAQARLITGIDVPCDLTARYAMKANPHPEILALLRSEGVDIDASSGYEAELALQAGYSGHRILLTSQQLAHNLSELVARGVEFNATSLHQLEEYGKLFPGSTVSIRLNPGIGSGHSSKTNVGGISSSFGIWHEYIPEVLKLADKYGLVIKRLHTHIGAGTDPAIWEEAIRISLRLIEHFEQAVILNLGGGFKVGRMDNDEGVDIGHVGAKLSAHLLQFYTQTGRKLKLELEPGTFLVANAGILVARVEDIVDTGKSGYTFLKLDTGMNDMLRPTLYGAQHPIMVLGDSTELMDYVVVGHNCESGDLLTPAPGKPDELSTRRLNKAAIGDIVLIGGSGAYCASMAAHGYNSFPSAREITID